LRDGLAYGPLAGRKSLLINIAEAPLPRFMNSGNWNAVQALHDAHFPRANAFDLLAPAQFDGIVPILSNLAANRCLTRVQDWVWEHFSAGTEAMADMTRIEEDIAPVRLL
jgi:hypothetical protein